MMTFKYLFNLSWFGGEDEAKKGLGELARRTCRLRGWTVVKATWKDIGPDQRIATVEYAQA